MVCTTGKKIKIMVISIHLFDVFVVYLKIACERTFQVFSTCRCMEENASHNNFQLRPIIAPLQDMKQGLQREKRKCDEKYFSSLSMFIQKNYFPIFFEKFHSALVQESIHTYGIAMHWPFRIPPRISCILMFKILLLNPLFFFSNISLIGLQAHYRLTQFFSSAVHCPPGHQFTV